MSAVSNVLYFGQEQCVPARFTSGISATSLPQDPDPKLHLSRDHVAVIIMARHLPGERDVAESWKLLCRAECWHMKVPSKLSDFDIP
jgi:hypothetical protein